MVRVAVNIAGFAITYFLVILPESKVRVMIADNHHTSG
jgi:hypothetical protein